MANEYQVCDGLALQVSGDGYWLIFGSGGRYSGAKLMAAHNTNQVSELAFKEWAEKFIEITKTGEIEDE